MPDEFPMLTPRVIEIGKELRETNQKRERLRDELRRIEKHGMEAAASARRILENRNMDFGDD